MFFYILVLLLISIIISVKIKKNENIRLICKKNIITFLGVYVTLFSLYVSVFNDVFNQYNSLLTPIEKLFKKEPTVEVSKFFTASNDTIFPNIVFVLDISGSTTESNVKCDDEIKESVKRINNSGFDDSKKPYTPIIDNSIKFSELLRLRLLSLLNRMKSYKGTFSIVVFSNTSEILITEKSFSNDNIDSAFEEVLKLNFNGEETNFCSSFESLINLFEPNSEGYDLTEKPKYSFVFLSDYIQDAGIENEKDKKCIRNSLRQINKTSFFLNFYFIDGEFPKRNSTNSFSISNLLMDINELKINKIGFDEPYNFSLGKIFSKNQLPFYYSNQLYEENLTTYLTFSELTDTKEYSFCISNFSNDRQQFRFNTGKKDNVKFLSMNPTKESISPGARIKFLMKGPIHNQNPGAELIIEDISDKTSCHVEIVFFKKLPSYLQWFIPVMAFFFFCFIVIILPSFDLRKFFSKTRYENISVVNNNDEKEPENGLPY